MRITVKSVNDELARLGAQMPRLCPHTMRVKEWRGSVVFLHEVAEGAAGRSWGVHVAQLAGVPAPGQATAAPPSRLRWARFALPGAAVPAPMKATSSRLFIDASSRTPPSAVHSITPSASASSVGGTSRPNALAVFMLMNSSTLVTC